MNFDDKVYIRNEKIEDIDSWYWIKGEVGAWDGPKKEWEESHKKRYLEHVKEKRVVITAGGNQGMYARLLSDIFQTVYVFEPDVLNFHCLVNNCQKENIIKFNCALGDKSDFVTLREQSKENSGMLQIPKQNKLTGIIPVMPLDTFDFPVIDLIQLDIEGYEDIALKGMLKNIEKHRPVIILENGHSDDVNTIMENLDYMYTGNSVADHIWVPK